MAFVWRLSMPFLIAIICHILQCNARSSRSFFFMSKALARFVSRVSFPFPCEARYYILSTGLRLFRSTKYIYMPQTDRNLHIASFLIYFQTSENLFVFEMNSVTSPHHEGNSSANFPKDRSREMIIPPKDLSIVWGRDSRYWRVPNDENSPVELHQVCWLEVTGCVNEISPNMNYEVIFELSLTPDAFGWAGSPIYLMVKRGKEGKFSWKKITLDTSKNNFRPSIVSSYKVMNDEMKAQESNDRKLYFGLYEVWSGKWKGGLKIFRTIVREV